MQISDILQSFSISFSFAELELRKLAKLMPPSLGATDRSVLQLTDVDTCHDVRLSAEEIGATWFTVSFPLDQLMAQWTKGALPYPLQKFSWVLMRISWKSHDAIQWYFCPFCSTNKQKQWPLCKNRADLHLYGPPPSNCRLDFNPAWQSWSG